MAFTYGFYNSVNRDRRYSAMQMSSIFDGIIKDGVFTHIGDRFGTKISTGMTVIVGTGRAWFDHTWSLNDTEMPIVVEPSDILQDRIDTIVLDVDHSENVRANSIQILKGQASTNPEPPALIKSDGHNQYPICDIFVRRNNDVLVQDDITNRVGTNVTPFAVSISQIPQSFLIPVSAWRSSTAHFPYDYEALVSVPGLDPDDLIRADFDLKSLTGATNAEVAPAGETSINSAKFYARSIPAIPLTGMYTIYKTEVEL